MCENWSDACRRNSTLVRARTLDSHLKIAHYECPEASFLSLKSTVFMRFDAISEFQKCAETTSSFLTYSVEPYKNFARVRRQTHNFFDTKHATDPSKHSADVVSLSQRRRPKFGCAQHQKRNRFASCLQPIRKFSNGNFCTNSAPRARFCNAKRCTDSSESFSHVQRLTQRTIGK